MISVPDKFMTQRVGASGYRVVDVDLDGVCANYTTGLVDFMKSRGLAGAEGFPAPDNYNLAKSTGWPFVSTAEYLNLHKEAVADGLYSRLPIYPGAAEALQTLSEHDVHIRIVTHRLFISGLHRQVIQDTNTWLECHGIPFMSLCFLGLKDSLTATLHIDDAPIVLEDLRAANKRVLIFDQPYNRFIPGARMNGWDGGAETILEILDSI